MGKGGQTSSYTKPEPKPFHGFELGLRREKDSQQAPPKSRGGWAQVHGVLGNKGGAKSLNVMKRRRKKQQIRKLQTPILPLQVGEGRNEVPGWAPQWGVRRKRNGEGLQQKKNTHAKRKQKRKNLNEKKRVLLVRRGYYR